MKTSTFNAPKNPNYAATVVALSTFVDLPNCDNVKAAIIFGNHVIVSKDTKAGDLGLFFPVETALSAEFLGQNNLYRKAEFGNVDPEKKGYFEQHGRIKAVKFRGHKSEGFWIPWTALSYIPGLQILDIGDTFDSIGDHEICRKYVPKSNRRGGLNVSRARVARLEDAFVENQFRFHFDTENLRRNIQKIQPTDWISISDKWHGTSVVIANLLVKRELAWYERLLKKIGVKVQDTTYGLAYSSRKVVKAVNGRTKASNHFYSDDIWGIVAKEIEDRVPKGFTIYGEIVGYTPQGGAIQGGYAYGCQPGTHKLVVYRVTSTNADGQTLELNWLQLKEFCTKYGFEMVKEFWYGQAKNFVTAPWVEVDHFQQELLDRLEYLYVNDQDCPYNEPGTPAEGIVLRVDRLNECESFKLKNFRFLEHESKLLDKGEADIETLESEPVEEGDTVAAD